MAYSHGPAIAAHVTNITAIRLAKPERLRTSRRQKPCARRSMIGSDTTLFDWSVSCTIKDRDRLSQETASACGSEVLPDCSPRGHPVFALYEGKNRVPSGRTIIKIM